MTSTTGSASIRSGMTLAAISMAAVGLVLLFVPELVTESIAPGGVSSPAAALLAAALLGFAAMNWTARGSTLGGIYGRAVVVANYTHTTIGTLVLVRRLLDGDATLAIWLLAGLYLAAAAFFTYLTFFSSGFRDR